MDLSQPDSLLLARSYIWPEDAERRRLFDLAAAKASGLTGHVEKADALEWLERQLQNRATDAVTVVYHSVFEPYLSNEGRDQLCRMMEEAGRSAKSAAPLAWLRFEPKESGETLEFYLDLRIWPHGNDIRIARAHHHGAWVEPL